MSSTDDLYGLVLVGGQSNRMGKDKSALDYHGVPQSQYSFDLLSEFLPKVFYSVKSNNSAYSPAISDQLDTKGPINGILSAMRTYPDKSWLVLACDLPLIDRQTIERLIAARNIEKYATAMATKKTGLPEPLVAIWEMNARDALIEHHVVNEKGCPRKFLLNNDIQLVYPDTDQELFNANNPEELEEAMKLLK